MRISRTVHSILLAGLLAGIPATRAAILTGGNGVYTIYVADADQGKGTGTCGTWTATTGFLHPAGSGQNVLYGGGSPGTSNTILHSYTSGVDYATGSGCTPLCQVDDPQIDPITSGKTTVGYRFTWSFADGAQSLTFVQEVVVEGPVDGTETFQNTVIRETHVVRNSGPDPLSFGLRKMWDWQIGTNDGPWFGSCETPSAACSHSMSFAEDSSLPLPQSYVINHDPASYLCPGEEETEACGGNPLYLVAGTVQPPSALDPAPDAPEILQFNAWPALSGSCWLPALMDNAFCGGGDTATAYFYGDDPGILLAPDEERSFTQYIVAGEDSCPDPIADTHPPVCSGSPAASPILGDGSATESETGDTGVASVALAPGAVNATLVVDPFTPGAASVTFQVVRQNPGEEALATVVVTDKVGQSCELTLSSVPAGPVDGEVLCLDQGILASVSNTSSTPAGNASCSSNEYGPGDPPLPPGYEPSPPTDPAPCTVLTIDSPMSGPTTLVYKKDGTFDPALRLLFSHFDGVGFPPFTDITLSTEPITDVIPDPTRLRGLPTFSLVMVTCALQAEVCDGLDNDGDGTADEGLPVGLPLVDSDLDGTPLCPASPGGVFDCNDQIASIYPGAPETCNGLDDDCEGGADEGNPGGGVACPVSGQLGVCAAGSTSCAAGALSCVQTVFPAAETCDGLDNDCDGMSDEGDADGDSVGDCIDNCPSAPNPGQGDRDHDGKGDACEDDFFSVAANQSGNPLLRQQHVYGRRVGQTQISLLAAFLPAALGLDALDVEGSRIYFSVANTGYAGNRYLQQQKLYRFNPSTGGITLSSQDTGLVLSSLDAIDVVGSDLIFSTAFNETILGVPLKHQDAYRYSQATRSITLVLSGVALGLQSLNAVDLYADGSVAFSTLVDQWLPTASGPIYLDRRNAYVYSPVNRSVALALDGVGLGLQSLDAITLAAGME